MSNTTKIEVAAFRLRVLARKNGFYTDQNAWDVLAEVSRDAISRRTVNAVKRAARAELDANGETTIQER
jgi:hypothetical protein